MSLSPLRRKAPLGRERPPDMGEKEEERRGEQEGTESEQPSHGGGGGVCSKRRQISLGRCPSGSSSGERQNSK